jgi:hypothetical protein
MRGNMSAVAVRTQAVTQRRYANVLRIVSVTEILIVRPLR